MERDIEKIKLAIRELAHAIEEGKRTGLCDQVHLILNGPMKEEFIKQPDFRCDCDKCKAIREGDNNGDDGVN